MDFITLFLSSALGRFLWENFSGRKTPYTKKKFPHTKRNMKQRVSVNFLKKLGEEHFACHRPGKSPCWSNLLSRLRNIKNCEELDCLVSHGRTLLPKKEQLLETNNSRCHLIHRCIELAQNDRELKLVHVKNLAKKLYRDCPLPADPNDFKTLFNDLKTAGITTYVRFRKFAYDNARDQPGVSRADAIRLTVLGAGWNVAGLPFQPPKPEV